MKAKLRKMISFTLVSASFMGVSGVYAGNSRVLASDEAEEAALGNLTPTAASCQTFVKNEDADGNPLKMYRNGEEVTYENGILTVPKSGSYASIYFTDLRENGYEGFSAEIGLLSSARDMGGEAEFRIYVDGEAVYESGTVNGQTEARTVEIDLSDAEVLQLVVDAEGSNAGDLAVWGNAHFTRQKDLPFLSVGDLEFSRSWQVTPENILEYVSAHDVNGNDITSGIRYTTDYSGEESGVFRVTYTAEDAVGNTHSRTVRMTVTGEDCTQELSLERLRQPWASYLYHGRGTLSAQGRKAWDLILSRVLDFQADEWKQTNVWGEDVYELDVDLQENGIFVLKKEMTSLASMFMDDEPRTFIMKDWACTVTEKDGMASHVKLWAKKTQADSYDELLLRIEGNTQKMLAEYQSDMTEAQALYYVSEVYRKWLVYEGGGQLLSDSLGNGKAVCGGNARGYIYLSQRLGSKSVWGRSGSHAWSFTKLADVKEWFKTDLLSGEFLAPGKNGEGNLSVGGDFRSRHYKWFVFGSVQYDRSLLRYPSVWISTDRENVILPADTEYDLLSYVSDFGSIFTQDLDRDCIQVRVDRLDASGETVRENLRSFPISGNTSSLAAGYYRAVYTVSDNGRSGTAALKIRVTGDTADRKYFADRSASTGNAGVQNPLGLWTGSEENWYDGGMYINESGSVTFRTEGENYRYVSFDFGIKDSVRKNVNWGMNGSVAAKVEVTTAAGTQTVYEGAALGWKTKYESILLELPADTLSVTVISQPKGSGNNHAGIGNLTFFRDSEAEESLPEENPPSLSSELIEIDDTDPLDIHTLLKGVDSEDGEFALTTENFQVETLDQTDGRYPAGTFRLAYQLTDSDGNVTSGFITVVVNRTDDGNGTEDGVPAPDQPDTDEPDTEEPDVEEPGADEPDTEEPDVEEPGTDEPDTEEPDIEKPDTGKPDTGGSTPVIPDETVKVDTALADSSVVIGNAQSVFPGGAVIKVESIRDGVIYQRVGEALKHLVAGMHRVSVFEFTAYRYEEAIQPSGAVEVTFAVPSGMSFDNLKMYYVDEQGNIEEISLTVNEQTGTASAKLHHFSTYVLADVSSDEADDVSSGSSAAEKEDVPKTGVRDSIGLHAGILVLSAGLAAAAVMMKKRNEI